MKNIKVLLCSLVAGFSLTSFAMAEAELDGYCPVCYVSAGKAVKGTEEFKSEHNGDTYYFVHAEAKAAFDKEPTKFLPAYEGFCAYGISLGKEIESDPTQFTVIDGVIYLSATAKIKARFETRSSRFIAKANRQWKIIMAKKEQ